MVNSNIVVNPQRFYLGPDAQRSVLIPLRPYIRVTPGGPQSIATVTPSGAPSVAQGSPVPSTQSTPVISNGSITGASNYSWLIWLGLGALVMWWLFKK